MKAFLKKCMGRYEYINLPEPGITSTDDVKIKVAYTTICSDETKEMGPEDYFSQDQIAGHEMSGIVVDAGDTARSQGFLPGVRVGGIGALPCGHCRMCRSGREQLCLEMSYSSGTLCDYIVWNYRQLAILPDNVSMQAGCLLEPMAGVLQAIERADIKVGDYVAIFGAGFSGLMLTKLAKMRGAGVVTVIEPLESRRQLALKYGADHVIDPNTPSIQAVLYDFTDFTGYDKVIESSANYDALTLSSRILARGGMLLTYTYYEYYHRARFNMSQLYLDNLTICSSFISNRKLDLAATALSQFNVDELISLEVPFEQADYAYQLEKAKQHIKIVIKI